MTSSKNVSQIDTKLQYEETLDIGFYINVRPSSDVLRYKLLTSPFKPTPNYDFKNDLDPGSKRGFNVSHLDRYPWMVYSAISKGVLCKNCVLFRPSLQRGSFGAFIVKGFKKFYQIHDEAKKHVESRWHSESTAAAKFFQDSQNLKIKDVSEQINSASRKLIEENREKLSSIIKTIVYCGTHDIALRGKNINEGNFHDLLDFRMDSGDSILIEHFKNCTSKTKYTSCRIQNELIKISGTIIQNYLVESVNNSLVFSIMADETADISGKEQMSIGVRYFDEMTMDIKEEFLGFTELKNLNSETIASSILQFSYEVGLNMNKLVGLGFDGCSTMAGKENGVQAIIRKKYKKVCFFHCASHRLNLVVNDLNKLPEIRNTTSIVKETIKFFRESILRRKLIPNIPLLCETRWSEKYKSIRIFSENVVAIKKVLDELTVNQDVNSTTRSRAFQLSCTTSKDSFIVCLIIMAKYSSILEPIVNKLQGVNTNLCTVHQYIKNNLLPILKMHRTKSEDQFHNIFNTTNKMACDLDIEIKIPRLANRQTNRSNYNTSTIEEYYRISLFLPYLDSIINSLESRFTESNEIPFKLGNLHPSEMITINKCDFTLILENLHNLYNIDNLIEEGKTWYDFWNIEENAHRINREHNVSMYLKDCEFFPSIKKCILIYLTIPPTTCTIERSFSTLRRVKTWIRSTMTEERLTGLCMLSLHRKKIQNINLVEKVIAEFSKNKRNLEFMFY